jgi:hypothetical protein
MQNNHISTSVDVSSPTKYTFVIPQETLEYVFEHPQSPKELVMHELCGRLDSVYLWLLDIKKNHPNEYFAAYGHHLQPWEAIIKNAHLLDKVAEIHYAVSEAEARLEAAM